MKRIVIKTIKIYQALISPILGDNCRFWPSCSEYTARAVEKYGLKKGIFLFLKRISKCHPWHSGGVDLP